MRKTIRISFGASMLLMTTVYAQQQSPAPQIPHAAFRSGVNLVLVDVAVRDKSGEIVKGLTVDDFELLEDGKRQQIVSFSFEQISNTARPLERASVLAGAAGPGTIPVVNAPAARPLPLTSEDVAGHRLLTLLFDTSSMQPEDVQKAADAAIKWVDEQMSPADLVAVASVGSRLQVLSDFTASKERVHSVLARFSGAAATAFNAVDASTSATDEANATDNTTAVDLSAQELDTFNNDVRLRAIRTLAEALAPIQQKKAIIYFSSGMQRSGTDNQVELRGAVNAAVRANVSIYPVDSRGLQALVPGGAATQGSRGGVGTFSGQLVSQQFTDLAAQQETLTTLAAETGGTAFTDTNDFGEAFAKVARDISAYYILGYASSNPARDGRYRRITVRLRNRSGVKVDAREGYYADRDFAHTAKDDREVQLQEQLLTQIPATDVPLFVTAGWFRVASDRYYVPVSVAVPGSAVAKAGPADKVTLDIAGFIRDERGFPVGRIRDTITVPPATTGALASRQVLYQTGLTLPPGHFDVRVVVRENTTGQMGTFETPIAVPELKQARVKVSSVVLSTQLQNASARRNTSPLVRDGVELVPNLTHVVGRNQKLYFYYEVYDPAIDNGTPQVRTSLAFYRGRVKVFETPVVERTQVDAASRHAALFQFEIPADSFKPGLYTCQVNIIDEVAARFAFPRLEMYVR